MRMKLMCSLMTIFASNLSYFINSPIGKVIKMSIISSTLEP